MDFGPSKHLQEYKGQNIMLTEILANIYRLVKCQQSRLGRNTVTSVAQML